MPNLPVLLALAGTPTSASSSRSGLSVTSLDPPGVRAVAASERIAPLYVCHSLPMMSS